MRGKEYKNKKLSTKTKEVYCFKFEKDAFPERKSREIFINKGIEVHYPFYEDKPKYKYIESLTFVNVSPSSIEGVGKSVIRGLGFTKNLSPIVKELERFPRIAHVIISRDDTTAIKGDKLFFRLLDLETIFRFLRPFNDKQSKEKRRATNNLLSDILPNKFHKDTSRYAKGDLTSFIVEKDLKNTKISDEDAKNIVEILPEEIKEQQIIYKIEEKVEIIKIKKAKREFEKLKSQKNDSDPLEKRWHRFFKENDWIFSYVLLLPVVIYGDEIYVGGKNIKNKGGKIADFLYKNSLTNNACILEIKTHKTPICNKSAYRGTDVFPLNGKFTGAIN
ncbi:MAG: Shedu anti-phage system protein SduA domain-containing protein, partial [Candidatus Paceibacterota bacterium]